MWSGTKAGQRKKGRGIPDFARLIIIIGDLGAQMVQAALTPCVSAPLPAVRPAWPLAAPASLQERVLTACAVVLPAAAAAAMRAGRAPRTLRGQGALVAAWLLRAMVAFCVLRAARRMQGHERSLVNETAAAVQGSRFLSIGLPTHAGSGAPGVSLHFLSEAIAGVPSAEAPVRPPVLLHLNHGFGANCFTWAPLLRSLAESHPRRSRPAPAPPLLAIAHDRVGFGLSSRPRQVWSYGSAVAARHAAALIASQAAQAAAAAAPTATASGGTADAATPGAAAGASEASTPSIRAQASSGALAASSCTAGDPVPDVVLLGHSVGAILAARLALLGDQVLGARVKGLVLIAPAAFLPRLKTGRKGQGGDGGASREGAGGEGGGGAGEEGTEGISRRTEGGAENVHESASAADALPATPPGRGLRTVGPADGVYSGTGTTNGVYSGTAPTTPRARAPALPAPAPRRSLTRLVPAAASVILRLLLFLPLRLFVRAIIGSEAFWRRGLSNAYRDGTRLTDDMVCAVSPGG